MTTSIEPNHLNAWRLFITTSARLLDQIDRELTDAGQIPLNWYDVLIELYEAPEHKLRMSELAERVVLSRSGLTRLVDRLEAAGYLHRELDPEDRRGFFAIITDAGTDALRKAWVVYARGIQTYFAQHLDDENAAALVKLFTRMLTAFTDGDAE